MKKRNHVQKCMRIAEFIEGQTNDFSVHEENTMSPKLDIIISKLDDESKRIIHNVFILKLGNEWSNEYYSKSTYYRLKNKAINQFLEQLDSL